MLKNSGFLIITSIVLCSYIQPNKSFLNAGFICSVEKLQEKTFILKSLPFDMNGMRLQFQYTVKKDIYTKRPKNEVILLAKKLVDITRQAVVCDLQLIMEDESYPVINIADIEKEKYNSEDFDDVNFDGYKDIREECKPCSGSLGNVEEIYLFNRNKKKFERWQSIMGINVEINPKNKTVRCYTKGSGDGQFNYQEIKFIGRGIQLYEKKVDCVILNGKKAAF